MDRHFEQHQLDRLITLVIKHNLGRVKGQPTSDTVTRKVWARRRLVAVRNQVVPMPEGQYSDTVSRWEIRNGGNPPVKQGQTVLIDDDGVRWRVVGVQPLGRRRRLELSCVILSRERSTGAGGWLVE